MREAWHVRVVVGAVADAWPVCSWGGYVPTRHLKDIGGAGTLTGSSSYPPNPFTTSCVVNPTPNPNNLLHLLLTRRT